MKYAKILMKIYEQEAKEAQREGQELGANSVAKDDKGKFTALPQKKGKADKKKRQKTTKQKTFLGIIW